MSDPGVGICSASEQDPEEFRKTRDNRKLERWCRYAAASMSRTDSGVSIAAYEADSMLLEEESRFEG